MNAIIIRYKKIVLLAMVLVGMSINGAEVTKCSPCAAAAAARQSIRDAAIQAALIVNPSNSREKELDVSENYKCSPCAAAAAARQSIRDAAAAALSIASTVARRMELDLNDNSEGMVRAPREALSSCDTCTPSPVVPTNSCSCVSQQLQGLINCQAICCAIINEKLDRQENEAEKCCKRITHELNEIETLVVSLIDAPVASCCSVVDNIQTLVTAQTAASAACCSVMDLQISNLNASVADVFVLLQSVWDCTCFVP